MKIIYSDIYKKSCKSKKYTTKVKEKIQQIENTIVMCDSTKEVENSNILKGLFKLERLKHELNFLFSMRIDNKLIRLLIYIEDNHVVFHQISYDHYKDVKKYKGDVITCQ